MTAYLNGVGMCTSLGMDRVTSQANYIAGEKEFFKDPKVIGVDGMPIRYAPVFPVHHVLNFRARFQKLATAAIVDLLAQVPETDRHAHIMLHLPRWLRDDHFGHQFSDWPIFSDWSPSRFHVIWDDQTSVIKALVRGLLELERVPDRDIIVLSIDTFLTAELLDFLTLQNRILRKGQPHGIIPSEAAVALRITAQDRVTPDAVIGWVDGHWDARETQNVQRPTGMIGDALADVMCAGSALAPVNRLLIDANGERWRAEELSMAFARASTISDDLTADFEAPPSQFGYSGGAMGAVMVGLALSNGHSATGPDQHSERQFVVTSSFEGERDAIGIVRDTRQRTGV